MRGEIWLVNLDPVVGSEAFKTRPAVIVGRAPLAHRAMANGRGVVPVVPVTSNTERVLSFQALLPAARTGLDGDSKAQCEQLRAVDVACLVEHVGTVPDDVMVTVDAGIRVWLDLP
ncbi:type II toxin-antitoxin system PemK/MazF family toxin [Cellulomonas phragmiteti]|uniref:mRNA interferase n=1 Tax=Cellulomonas phragmiteti TaxID=478780 RepID=A0ABQ4DQB7_9CELL|nr:type II toxin-antitoxin system PemK/MazF family toxin [Cellulomonas phragmiteti]GIG41121.1 endoribonuclease MazF9 [Cellulomonas phragmiteti]